VDRRDPVGAGDRDLWPVGGQLRVDRLVTVDLAQRPLGDAPRHTVGTDLVRGRAEEHELVVAQPREQWVRPASDSMRSRIARSRRPPGAPSRPPRRARRAARPGAGSSRSISTCVHASTSEPYGSAPAVGDVDQLVLGPTPHVQHRVHQEVDDDPVAVEDHAHRVDQERGVIGDDQGDRTVGVPAVPIAIG
jgi:hypothetical protein